MPTTNLEEMTTPKLVRELIVMNQAAALDAVCGKGGSAERDKRLDAVVTELICRGVLD